MGQRSKPESLDWSVVKQSLADALEKSQEERAAMLALLQEDDPKLAGKLRSLLRSHGDAGTFLVGPAFAPRNTPSLRPGDQVGPYEIQSVLGEGGFSFVYGAYQEEPIRREVALKVIKPGMDSNQVLQRFAGERHTLARMQHPGIATVLDGGTTDSGHPYFVMERVGGEPITEFCAQQQLPLIERIDLFIQVCHAVQHAHQKGVVHRDIKPSNVLVGFSEDFPQVKVIDFGIAKTLLPDDASGEQMTQEGTFLGTPEYMSPEQARGNLGDLDTRADVYSLGVLLYEMLTGQRPFDKPAGGINVVEELRRIICEVDPPKPSTRVSKVLTAADAPTTVAMKSLRGDLDWIVMRAMEKDRERRYPSAIALADDLERYLQHEPVVAGPPSRMYRMSKFARRNRGAIAGMLLTFLALSSGLGFAAFGLKEAKAQTIIANSARDAESKARTAAENALTESERQKQLAQKAVEAEKAANTQALDALGEAKRQETMARASAEREAEIRRRVEVALREAQASEEFLEDTLKSAKPDGEPGSLSVLEVLNRSAEDLDITEEFADFPAVKGRMYRVLAETYVSLGDLEKGEDNLGKSLEILRSNLGRNDESVLVAEGALCVLRYQQSRQGEVEDLVFDLAKRAKEHLGPNHEVTLDAESRVAGHYFETAQVQKGIALLEDLIPRQVEKFGAMSFAVIGNMSNLAVMYGYTGRPEDALSMAQKSVEMSKGFVGESHPRTMKSEHVLATILVQANRFKDAALLLEDLVPRRIELEGEEHIHALGSLNLLALAQHKSLQFEKGEVTYRKALEIQSRVLGRNHRQTIMCIHNLGMLLGDLKKHGESEPLLRESAELFTALRGQMHPEAVQARYRHCYSLVDLDRFQEAEAPYGEVVAEIIEVFGADHWLTKEATTHYAGYLRSFAREKVAEKEYMEAEAPLQTVLALWSQLGNSGFPVVLSQELSDLYGLMQKPEEQALWKSRADEGRK